MTLSSGYLDLLLSVILDILRLIISWAGLGFFDAYKRVIMEIAITMF